MPRLRASSSSMKVAAAKHAAVSTCEAKIACSKLGRNHAMPAFSRNQAGVEKPSTCSDSGVSAIRPVVAKVRA
jgi:hypothetical protein